jgi:hypothetical protein
LAVLALLNDGHSLLNLCLGQELKAKVGCQVREREGDEWILVWLSGTFGGHDAREGRLDGGAAFGFRQPTELDGNVRGQMEELILVRSDARERHERQRLACVLVRGPNLPEPTLPVIR